MIIDIFDSFKSVEPQNIPKKPNRMNSIGYYTDIHDLYPLFSIILKFIKAFEYEISLNPKQSLRNKDF